MWLLLLRILRILVFLLLHRLLGTQHQQTRQYWRN
jgi:hypothetical protein